MSCVHFITYIFLQFQGIKTLEYPSTGCLQQGHLCLEADDLDARISRHPSHIERQLHANDEAKEKQDGRRERTDMASR
jgi:hypothetical protein